MKVLIGYFRNFKSSQPRMAKESSLQLFPIDLFVQEAYRVMKILHNYDGLRRNSSLLT